MTAQVYSEEQKIPFYFSNANGEISLGSLLNLVLLVSENQLLGLNLDGESMVEKGYGWIVTQYHIDIKRLPKINERVKAYTQAKTYNKFFCYRDFWIEDMDGNELVHINSIFVLIDLKERSMVKIAPEIVEPLGAEHITGMEKLPRIKKEKEYTSENDIHIGSYNIDINHHVNNSYYFDWMLDSLDIEFLKQHKIKSVDIKYEHELAFGDTPKALVKIVNEDDSLKTKHCIVNGDKRSAEAIINWD